jgi:hypothetical protein
MDRGVYTRHKNRTQVPFGGKRHKSLQIAGVFTTIRPERKDRGKEDRKVAYTIWSKEFSSHTWTCCGLQSDSEKVAMQAFTLYPLAPGETLQLRDPDGIVLDERLDKTRPHDAS